MLLLLNMMDIIGEELMSIYLLDGVYAHHIIICIPPITMMMLTIYDIFMELIDDAMH
jgi:hypothetical protein